MSARRVYLFHHNSRVVSFGPHESEQAARVAFQFTYGYWPGVLVGSHPWEVKP